MQYLVIFARVLELRFACDICTLSSVCSEEPGSGVNIQLRHSYWAQKVERSQPCLHTLIHTAPCVMSNRLRYFQGQPVDRHRVEWHPSLSYPRLPERPKRHDPYSSKGDS